MKSILIVTSAPTLRDRFSQILSSAGYHVIEVESGEAAIEAASSVHIDLVLMAIVMPKLNGLQTASRLRALSNPNTLRIVVLGTIPPIGIDENPLASLIDDYLNLDVGADELLACVARHVGT